MNHKLHPRLLCLTLMMAAITPPAQADIFKKAGKGIKKATNTVAKETTKAADKVADGVVDTSKTVVSGTKSVLSSDEVKSVSATAKKTYASTLKEGEAAYKQTMSAVKSGIDAAREAALRAAAEAYLKKYKVFLGKFRSNIDALAKDEAARVIVNRLVKAAAEKRLDDQARADLLVIGDRLGLLEWSKNSIVPGSSGGAMRSSWGLAAGGGAAYVGGAEGTFGFVANCYKEPDQRYGAGLAISVGGVLGLAFGGAADVTFFWQPGGVSDAEGGYIGLGVEASYAGIGGTLGLQWGLSEGMKGAAAATPGFYLGWSAGVKVKAGALDGGYTWVPVKSTK